MPCNRSGAIQWASVKRRVRSYLAKHLRSTPSDLATVALAYGLAAGGWMLASKVGINRCLGAWLGVAVLPLSLISRIAVSALRGFHVSKHWLVEPTTSEEIEAQLPDAHPRFRAEWEAFKAAMVEGDSLWVWITPPATWEHLCGRKGYVIVRDGEPTDRYVVTIMT